MAKFDECVSKAVKAGIIDNEQADDLLAIDDPIEALSYAEATIAQKKLQAARDAVVFEEIKKDVYSHPRGPFVGYLSVMVRDKYGMSNNRNVDKMAISRSKKYLAKIPELVSALRTRTFGLTQDTELLENLIRALHGQKVDDAFISGQAGKVQDLLEEIRLDFNRMGGVIRKNQNYNMPNPKYDDVKVRAMGRQKFIDTVMPELNRDLMVDDAGKLLDDEQLKEALSEVFDTITTGGLNKVKGLGEKPVSMGRMGKKLANRHSEARFIHYKDGDAWLRVNKAIGSSDGYQTIVNHIEGMAHEIALMERFGSNPNQMHETFMAMLGTEAKQAKGRFALDWTFNIISGKVDPRAQPGIAHKAQAVRNIITASTLGSASISSVFSDPFNAAITASFNSLSGVKVGQRYLKLLNPANEQDRIFAARAGFILEGQLNAMGTANRFADAELHGVTGKAAEVVIRASGLSAMTDALKAGFGLEFAGRLADDFGKSFDELHPKMQKSMRRSGITSDDWDAFRKTPLLNHGGATFADVTQKGGEKFHEMILNETSLAVPEPDAFVRGILAGGTMRGTWGGEMFRFFGSLKGYPTSIITTHVFRMMYQTTGWDKATYMANFFIGGAVMGGLTLQLKDIAMGREPRPVDGKYIAAAMAQSGGLGIFGDFLFTDQNRFGSSIANTLVGPSGELLDKGMKLTAGNLQQVIAGEDTDFIAESVEFMYRYSPKVWWTRPMQNTINEQIQLMVDNSAGDKFRRIERKREKEFKQGYWWKPGQAVPEALR